MLAGLNGLDYAILAIVGFSVLNGLARGALRMITSVIAIVLGIYLAATYYGAAAGMVQRLLGLGPTPSALFGYAVIFLLVLFAVEYAGWTVIRVVRLVSLGWIDMLAGAAVGAVVGCIIAGLALAALTAVLPDNPPLLRDSMLAPRVTAYNQTLVGFLPAELKNTYQAKRDELLHDWSQKQADPAAEPSPAQPAGSN